MTCRLKIILAGSCNTSSIDENVSRRRAIRHNVLVSDTNRLTWDCSKVARSIVAQ